MTLIVPLRELSFKASRAGGPGGQHVNKAATRIEVRWDVARSPSLSAHQRARLMERLSSRMDAGGVIRLAVDEHRSQHRNRETAVQRLRDLVQRALHVPKRRRATQPPTASLEGRLREKRQRSELKRTRRAPEPED